MGNWKIENSESSWMSAALPLDYEQSLCFLIVRRERSEKNRPRESWCTVPSILAILLLTQVYGAW